MKLQRTDPVFLVDGILPTVRWYETNLGCQSEVFPPSPPHFFGVVWRDDVVIMFQQLDGYRKPDHYDAREGGVWDVYLRVEGIRELYDSLSQRAAVTIIQPLHLQEYGQQEFEVRDPNGYVIVFAQSLSRA
jgi:hypothetical protein